MPCALLRGSLQQIPKKVQTTVSMGLEEEVESTACCSLIYVYLNAS